MEKEPKRNQFQWRERRKPIKQIATDRQREAYKWRKGRKDIEITKKTERQTDESRKTSRKGQS